MTTKQQPGLDAKARQKIGMRSGVVGIVCNIVLFLMKLILGRLANSISVTADALNNLSDAGSSIVTLAGFKIAGKSADKKHPYGYGRVEYLSGLVVAFLILLTGVEMGKAAIERLFHPQSVESGPWILAGLIFSIVLKLWLWFFNYRLGKKTESSTLTATAMDSISDVFVTSVTLVAVLLSGVVSFPIDGIMGLVVATFILFAGFGVARDTLSPLLGERTDPDLVRKITDIILSYDGILGLHELEVHDYGPSKRLASIHVEVSEGTDIVAAHEIIDRAEAQVEEELGIETVIHLDPVQTGNEEVSAMRTLAQQLVTEVNPSFAVHSFRLLEEDGRLLFLFELSVPTGTKEKDGAIRAAIEEKLSAVDTRYKAVIHIDRTCY